MSAQKQTKRGASAIASADQEAGVLTEDEAVRQPLSISDASIHDAIKLMKSPELLEGAVTQFQLSHGRPLTVGRVAPTRNQVVFCQIFPLDMKKHGDTVLFHSITAREPAPDSGLQRFYFMRTVGAPFHIVTDAEDPSACVAPHEGEPFRSFHVPDGAPNEHQLHPCELVGLISAGIAYLVNGFPGDTKRRSAAELAKLVIPEQRPFMAPILTWLGELITRRLAGTEGEALRSYAACPTAAWAVAFDGLDALDPSADADFGIPESADAAAVIQAMATPPVTEQRLKGAADLIFLTITSGAKEARAARQSAVAARAGDKQSADAAKAPETAKSGKAQKAPKTTKAAKAPKAKPGPKPGANKRKEPPAAEQPMDEDMEDVEEPSVEQQPAPQRRPLFPAARRPFRVDGLPAIPRKQGAPPSGPRPLFGDANRRGAPVRSRPRAFPQNATQPTSSQVAAARSSAPRETARPNSNAAGGNSSMGGNMGGAFASDSWQQEAWEEVPHDEDDPIEEDGEAEDMYGPEPFGAHGHGQPWGGPVQPSAPWPAPAPQLNFQGGASSAPFAPSFSWPFQATAPTAPNSSPAADATRAQHGLPSTAVSGEQLRLVLEQFATSYQHTVQCFKDGRIGTKLVPSDNPAVADWAKGGAAIGTQLLDAGFSTVLLLMQQAFGSGSYAALLADLEARDVIMQRLRAAGAPHDLLSFMATHFANLEATHIGLRTASRGIVGLRALLLPTAPSALNIDRAAASPELLRSRGSASELLKESAGYGLAGAQHWQRLEGSEAALKDARKATPTLVSSPADFVASTTTASAAAAVASYPHSQPAAAAWGAGPFGWAPGGQVPALANSRPAPVASASADDAEEAPDLVPFQYQSLDQVAPLLTPGCWMVKYDLRKGYYHLALHPDTQRLLTFRWRGRLYVYQALCFGVNVACRVFTKLMRAFAKYWAALGVRLCTYIDDGLFICPSREAAELVSQHLRWLAPQLGLVFSSKSDFTPTQVTEYLGLEIDTRPERGVFTVTPRKVAKITALIDETLSAPAASIRALQRLAGKLIALRMAFPAARLMTRPVFAALAAAETRGLTPFDPSAVPVQGALKEALVWVQRVLPTRPHHPIWEPLRFFRLFTDASGFGFAAFLDCGEGPPAPRARRTARLMISDALAELARWREAAWAARTNQAATRVWRRYLDFLATTPGKWHPADEKAVLLFLASAAHSRNEATGQPLAPSTIQGMAAHIWRILKAERLIDPNEPRSWEYLRAIRGMTRALGRPPAQKRPLGLSQLLSWTNTAEFQALAPFDRLSRLALMSLGISGLLRISEVAALRQGDVVPVRSSSGRVLLRVTVARSKTDQVGHGEHILVASAPAAGRACPVRATATYVNAVNRIYGPRPPSAPFFLRGPPGAAGSYTDDLGRAIIKQCACDLGLDPDDYSGHSLRRGGARSAARGGASATWLRRHGRWALTSMVPQRYVDDYTLAIETEGVAFA
eukprot:tig00021275_g19881.t1